VPWERSWSAVKDVILTGTGIGLIVSQVFTRSPSDALLVTGLALTVPSVAAHATALLTGPSSPSSPPPGAPPSSSISGGEGNGAEPPATRA
jgi:hypothetical protein